MNNSYRLLGGQPAGQDHLGDVRGDENIILK
jgi:hypothetical protein